MQSFENYTEMATETFIDIGKVEAVERLFKDSGFTRSEGGSFTPGAGSVVRTASRLFVEGMDFNLVYFPLKHLGYKCVVAATGELLASMAHPRTLSLRLGLSAKLDLEHVKDLWTGIVTAAREYSYESLDLDLVPSPNGLTIGVSVAGEVLAPTLGHTAGARSKDLLCVSGRLGAAFLGQQILEREKRRFEKTGDDSAQPDLERYRMLLASYLKPELSPSLVSRLEEAGIYPSCGYLLSRGLADALKRLTRDTGLGAKVYADKIPFEGNSFATGKEMDIDPVSAAMNGGADYQVLYVIPILSAEKFRRDFQTFEIIGHLAKSEVGAVLVSPDGLEHPVTAQGWPREE